MPMSLIRRKLIFYLKLLLVLNNISYRFSETLQYIESSLGVLMVEELYDKYTDHETGKINRPIDNENKIFMLSLNSSIHFLSQIEDNELFSEYYHETCKAFKVCCASKALFDSPKIMEGCQIFARLLKKNPGVAREFKEDNDIEFDENNVNMVELLDILLNFKFTSPY